MTMRCLPLLLVLLLTLCARAQPLIDLFSVNALASRGLDRAEVSATLPLRLDTTGRLLVLDPYYVQWHTSTTGDRYTPVREGNVVETMRGYGGAITYVAPLRGGQWKLAFAGIGRYHWSEARHNGDLQYGGVLLASRVLNPSLTLRAGVYSNYDAFGWFVIPLLGIDWRIDAKHNLYGILPGVLTYEHKCSPHFHWGAAFRAYTSSYGVRGGDYRRLDENPLGLYGDIYFTRNLVMRLEGGWSCIRQVRGGPGDPLYDANKTDKDGYADHRIADAPYARVILAYRLRLDGPTQP